MDWLVLQSALLILHRRWTTYRAFSRNILVLSACSTNQADRHRFPTRSNPYSLASVVTFLASALFYHDDRFTLHRPERRPGPRSRWQRVRRTAALRRLHPPIRIPLYITPGTLARSETLESPSPPRSKVLLPHDTFPSGNTYTPTRKPVTPLSTEH